MRDGKTISTTMMADATEEKIVTDMVGRKIDSYYPKEKADIGKVVLEVKHMTVPHPYAANKKIVQDVSFSVRGGEILGIGGLVGAGRSELVNAIFRKIIPETGEILMEGKPLKIRSCSDAIRAGIALVTEDRKTDGIVGLSLIHI